ncbi:hypothetical protein LLG95_06575 [bacterium]|nr:hypothetical protein [bacterium]
MTMPAPEHTPVAGCLTRLYWMVGGVIILIFLGYSIVAQGSPSIYDAMYWIVVLSLVLVRFADIQFMHGQTAEGKPATMSDWRRYVLGLASGALGVWLVLHGINFMI